MMIEEPQKRSIKCQTKKEAQKKEKPDIKEPQNKNHPTAQQKEGRWEGKTKRGN